MRFSAEALTWRFAKEDDSRLYFGWVNEQSVRENSHHSEPVTWEAHEEWFRNRLNSRSLMLVFIYDNKPVGQVRVDREGNNGIIDYSVDKNFRGKNIGTSMLRILKTLLDFSESPLHLCGVVKAENIASMRVFENSGFTLYTTMQVSGVKCLEYRFNFK